MSVEHVDSLPLINQMCWNKNSNTIMIIMINEDNKWSLYLLTKNGKNLIMRKTVAGFWFYATHSMRSRINSV